MAAAACCTCVGVARILCYKCCCCVLQRSRKSHTHRRSTFNVLCLGLQGAGKSTLLATLQGEEGTDVQPTKGFSIKVIQSDHVTVNIKELGGGLEVIEYWSRYYEGQDGLMVVMDASDKDGLAQACSTMKVHLEDPRIAPLPCLILLNKKNKTLTDAEVAALLEEPCVTELVGSQHHLRLVRVCSAADEQALREAMTLFTSTLLSTYTEAFIR